MYAGDTFYGLPAVGQVGLIVLSGLLAVAAMACLLALFRLSKSLGLRIVAALAVFWIFLWLSPQIYYFLYQVVLDDLPRQIVIGRPPAPLASIELLSFSGPATLAGHAKGVLGWALILLGLWPRRRLSPPGRVDNGI